MESSLQFSENVAIRVNWQSFNPCFNGIFSSIIDEAHHVLSNTYVSILVLMESSLQSYGIIDVNEVPEVSILVLMESSLQ